KFRELNPITCHGDTDGSLLFIADDDQIQLTYEWNVNGQTNPRIDNIGAGNYEVKITDQNQCSFSYNYDLLQPEILSTQFSLSSSLCDEDQPSNLVLSAMGGFPTYTFQWQTGETTDKLSDISFGQYFYTVTDFNQC